MVRTFGHLQVGDVLVIDGTRYRVAGCLTLSTPDGEHWNEWRLAPQGSVSNKSRELWLSGHDGRMWLWTPSELAPEGFSTLGRGDHLALGDRRYVVASRDNVRVQLVRGDVGEMYRQADSWTELELIAGTHRFCVEWGDGQVGAYSGQPVSNDQLRRWSAAGNTDLDARAAPLLAHASRRRTTSPQGGDDMGLKEAFWVACVLVPLFVLSSCDTGEDCYRRYNRETRQYERHCEGGLRYGAGRSFGGWGGK